MSVTIHDYLVANDNELTALFNNEGIDEIFLEDTFIEVRQRQEDWWCDFFLNYTITCNDLADFASMFAGYWWCVSPYYGDARYCLSVCLKDMQL